MEIVRKQQATTVPIRELPYGSKGSFWWQRDGVEKIWFKTHQLPAIDGFIQVVAPDSGETLRIFGGARVRPVNPIPQEPETIAWKDRPEASCLFMRANQEHDSVYLSCLGVGIKMDDFAVAVNNIAWTSMQDDDRITIIEGTFVEKGAEFYQEGGA